MALGRGNIEIDIRGNVDTAGIARQVTAAEKQIRPLSVSLNEKGFRQPLGRISGDLAEFQKSLDASVARTLAFGAAVGVINAVSDGFRAIVDSAVEVEKALSDINVILNLNAGALQQFSDQLFDVAKNTGQSFQTVAEAAVELSRQGLGAEETLSRINDAMILTRLSGMDAAKSVETLTAAVNSFGDTALTTTNLVNKLATVDAAFAVSTEDLANALARSGASAQAAKVDLNELLAAVTSVQQTTARGGSVIGNAFKSIFTRLQRSGVREALEEIGVATTDAAGNIRGALAILTDYAGVYGTLTDSQKAYTDELVAGVFQINNLRALVKDLGSDYSIYQRALDESNNATDEAVRRNEKLQETLSSLINEASVNAKELAASLGELVATPAIENLLELFNSVSAALREALDPEQGFSLIRTMFDAIGKFIAGPGLIIIGAAFIKLFKFITQQSLKAVSEVFKIGSAANKVADAEAKIGFLLKNNRALYEAISNEALTHEQREELVLQTIKQQNRAYAQQQALISRLAKARTVQSAVNVTSKAQGFIPQASKGYVPHFATGTDLAPNKLRKGKEKAKASGFIPNFSSEIEGAIHAEKSAISTGVGGASKSAKPKVLKNFPMGGGKRQTIVANTDEVIVPRFGGGTGSAIFNQEMIKQAGMPDHAIPVSNGYIPNYAQSKLQTDKNFQNLLGGFEGVSVDVQRDMSGFGMLTAKGKRGNLETTRKPGFSKEDKLKIIDSIGGSKLNKDDKSFLLTTIGGKKKTRFSNIPAQTIESADPEQVSTKVGSLNNLINPYIADAVANVATNIYTRVLGDEVSAQNLVKSVRTSANADQGIISKGAQGAIFESAVRLGSKESAKNLAKDNKDGIWDFEESSAMSADLKALFFPTSNIYKADAKRTGDQNNLREVVDKAYKADFSDQLKQIYAQNWSPIVKAAVQTAPAKQKTERRRTGTNLAGGYIPNFITSVPSKAIAPFQAKQKDRKEYKPKDIRNITNNKTELSKFVQDVDQKQFERYLINNLRNEDTNWNRWVRDNFLNKKNDWSRQNYFSNINKKSLAPYAKTYGIVGKKAGYVFSNQSQTPDWTTTIGSITAQDTKSSSRIGGKLDSLISEGFFVFDSVQVPTPETTKSQIDYKELRGRLDSASKTFLKQDSKELNFGDILNFGNKIFPASPAKIDDSWRERYTNIVNNNKGFYESQLKEYSRTTKKDTKTKLGPKQQSQKKAFATGRIFEEIVQSAQKAVIGETNYLSKLDTQNWDYYSLTQAEKDVLNISSDFGEYKTSLDNSTNEGSFIKKFIREPYGRGAAGGFIPSFVEQTAPKVPQVLTANDGFIPNFVGDKIGWKIDKAKGDYAITGSNLKLGGFSEYLKQVSEKDSSIVSKRAAETFEKRVKQVNTQHVKDREETSRKNPIGFGRQGAKHYGAMDAVSRKERSVSTNGLFIKDLGKHVKQYNQHNIFAADKIGSYDSFLADGYIPNFTNQVYDKDKIQPQVAGQILQNILSDNKKKNLFIGPSGVGKSTLAAKYGEFIKSIEDVKEATSYTILSGAGKTKSGGMSPALLKIIEAVNGSGGKVSYLSASDEAIEKRREKRISSPLKGDLRSEGQLKGTRFAPKNQPDFANIIKRASNRFEIINAAEGAIPNFLDIYRGIKVSKSVNPTSRDVFQGGEKSKGKFRPSQIYSIPQLQDYLQAHAQSALGTGLVSSSTNRKTAESFASTSDPAQKGVVARKSMSHRRMYNPRKVEKLVGFLMQKRGMSERDAVQWFVKQAQNKPIGFDVKRWLNDLDYKQFAAEDEIAILNKSSFDTKDYARGLIPNFITEIQNGSRASLFRKKSKGNKNAKTRNFKHSVYLKNGERLSGVADNAAQDPFIGYDKNNQEFSVRRQYIKPEDIVRSKDGNKTAEKIKKELIQGKVFSTGYIPNFSKESSKEINNVSLQSSDKTNQEKSIIELFNQGYIPNYISDEKSVFEKAREKDSVTEKESYSTGYIPNFANALQDAISREKKALRQQGSSAKVYVDKDRRVKSPKNPMGLLVANRRDEPQRGSQGVDRALSMGMDPKTHGMATGYVPNFANQFESTKNIDKSQSHTENNKSEDYIPNYVMSQKDFAKFSVAISNFNRKNAIIPPLKALSSRELIKIPMRNMDVAKETVENVRQFISSEQYRALNPATKKEVQKHYNKIATRTGVADASRPFTRYSDPGFEGKIAAAKGLIPSFIDNRKKQTEESTYNNPESMVSSIVNNEMPNFVDLRKSEETNKQVGSKSSNKTSEAISSMVDMSSVSSEIGGATDKSNFSSMINSAINKPVNFDEQTANASSSISNFINKDALINETSKSLNDYSSKPKTLKTNTLQQQFLNDQISSMQNTRVSDASTIVDSSAIEKQSTIFNPIQNNVVDPKLPKTLARGHNFLEGSRGENLDVSKRKVRGVVVPNMIVNEVEKFTSDNSEIINQESDRKNSQQKISDQLETIRNNFYGSSSKISEATETSKSYAIGSIPNFIENKLNDQNEPPSTLSQKDAFVKDYAAGLIPNFASKNAYVFDFDDTLAVTEAKSFKDFSDPSFVESAQATRYASLAKRRSRLGDDIHVLTARIGSKGINSAISNFMQKVGAPAKSVIGVAGMFKGETEPGAKPGKTRQMGTAGKKQKVLSQLAKRYAAITFLDDSKENVLRAEKVAGVKAVQAQRGKLFKAMGFLPNFIDTEEIRNTKKNNTQEENLNLISETQKSFASSFIPNYALSPSMIQGLRAKLRPGSGATEAEKKSAKKILEKEQGLSQSSIRNIKDFAILENSKYSRKQVQEAIRDVVIKRNDLELDPEPIDIDRSEELNFANEYIKTVNSSKSSFVNKKLLGTPVNASEVSMALKGQGSYRRGKYIPQPIKRTAASGYIPNFVNESLIENNNYANSYIPNFANELQEAVVREKEVLQAQGSSAKIYVDQDKRVKTPKNPLGLLVANKRDEPTGGFQGVNRAMSMGMNPKTHGMADGYIPNFAQTKFVPNFALGGLGSISKSLSAQAKKAGKSLDELGKNVGVLKEKAGEVSFAKVMGMQFALSGIESAADKSLTSTQAAVGVLETFGTRLKGIPKAIIIAIAAMIDFSDEIAGLFGFETAKAASKNLKEYNEALTAQLNIIQQNIEKIDKFGAATAKFGEAAKAGKIDAAGAFLQEILQQGGEVASLNPQAFKDVISAIGDTRELPKAIEEFKRAAEVGKTVKQFSADLSKIAQLKIEDDDLGLKELEQKAGVTFSAISTSLTKNLKPEQVDVLADSLENFDFSSGKSGEKLVELVSQFGEVDDTTKSLLLSSESLSTTFLKQIREQSLYANSINEATEAFKITQAPIKQLENDLNALANQLTLTAETSKDAIKLLSETGKIQAQSRVETLQATSVVSQPDLLAGKAAADIKNGILEAAKLQQTELKTFAAKLIQDNEKGVTVLAGGLKTIVDGIASGGLSNDEAIRGLVEVQKKGSPEQQAAAQATIEQLRSINAGQIKNAATTQANLQAQLQAINNQAVTFQRNTQLSESQLTTLSNFDQALKEGNREGIMIQKSSLERITELKDAISTIESLGGDSEILAELKAQNQQLSQLENLKAAFESLTGQDSQAASLQDLNQEILEFDLSTVEGEVAGLVVALRDGVKKAIDADSGVSGAEDVEKAAIVNFPDDQIQNLSSAMSEAISQNLNAILEIDPSLLKEINPEQSSEKIATAIQELSTQNEINTEKNAEATKQMLESLKEPLTNIDFTKLDNSSGQLEQAATALKEAAAKLKETRGGSSAASGFVPNYAPPVQAVNRALRTEKAMGARKPVVDSHPSIGTYVRDAATQPNFSAVKKDHPEGIKQATENSKKIQAVQARGFVPNYALAPDAITPLVTQRNSVFESPSVLAENFVPNFDPIFDKDYIEKAKKGSKALHTGKYAKESLLEKLQKQFPKDKVKSLAQKGMKSPTFIGLLSEAALSGVRYFTGKDTDVSSIIEAAYFGGQEGLAPFVNQGNLKQAYQQLNKYHISKNAINKTSSLPMYPKDFSPRIEDQVGKNFDPAKQGLFNLALSNIDGIKAWAKDGAITSNMFYNIGEDLQNYGAVATSAGLGITLASPLTGPAAPITATVGAATLKAGAISYVIGSMSEILGDLTNEGIRIDDIVNVSNSSVRSALEANMDGFLKTRANQAGSSPSLFANSKNTPNIEAQKTNGKTININEALKEANTQRWVTARNFFTNGDPQVPALIGFSADEQKAAQLAFAAQPELGWLDIASELSKAGVEKSPQVFTDLNAMRGFHDNLTEQELRLKLPFDFKSLGFTPDSGGGWKVSNNPTSWTKQELSTLQQDIKKQIAQKDKIVSNLKTSISKEEQAIATQKQEGTLPEKLINDEKQLTEAKSRLSSEQEWIKQYKSASEDTSKYINLFDRSESSLERKKEFYNELTGGSLLFPSPIRPLEEYSLAIPQAPEKRFLSNTSESKTIDSSNRASDGAQKYIDAVFSSTSRNKEKINEFLNLDYKGFVNKATALKPQGVTEGVRNALSIFQERAADKSFIFKPQNITEAEKTAIESRLDPAEAGVAAEEQLEAGKELSLDQIQELAVNLGDADPKSIVENVKKERSALEQKQSNIRDYLYLKQLGQDASETRTSNAAIQALERIERIKQNRPQIVAKTLEYAEDRKRRIQFIEDNPKTASTKNLEKYKTELATFTERAELYSSEDSTPFLYFTNGERSVVDGVNMPPPIWKSIPDYQSKYTELRESLSLDKTTAEKELQRLQQENNEFSNANFVNDMSNVDLFSKIRNQNGNTGSITGKEFETLFAKADPATFWESTEGILTRLNLTTKPLTDNKVKELLTSDKGAAIKQNIQENLAAISGGRGANKPFDFFVNELLHHSDNADQQAVMVNTIKNLGIPFSETGDMTAFLEQAKVDIDLPQMKNTPFQVPALEGQDVGEVVRFVTDFQLKAVAARAQQEIDENKDAVYAINQLLGQADIDQLIKTPVFVNQNAQKEKILQGFLNQVDQVENKDQWRQKYTPTLGGTEGNVGDVVRQFFTTQTSYGNYQPNSNLSDNLNDSPVNDNGENVFIESLGRALSPKGAAEDVMGDIDHGINSRIKELVENSAYPFSNITSSDWGDRHNQAVEEIYSFYKNKPNKIYAPFGYTKNGKASPSGKPNKVIEVYDYLRDASNLNQTAAGVKQKAKGFVPNFSSVVGEIIASKAAGYDSPVTSSQVKTMSIPGVGKTAYNTQESVFKLPGMTQPFITPPSNSDAAEPYKKEVQKKFNFNPYQKTAADGFVPNFRGGINFNDFNSAVRAFGDVIDGFGKHISTFNDSIRSLDFREFASASSEINQAAKTFSAQSNTFKQAAETIQRSADKFGNQSIEVPTLDFSGLNSAASQFSSGATKLANKLSKPIDLNASALISSMNSLTSALGNIQGNIDVNIPDVNVNVQGNVTSAVRAAIQSEVPAAVNSALASVDISSIATQAVKSYLGVG